MTAATWLGSRARLIPFVLRSPAARQGPRRTSHPFVTDLAAGQVIPHQGGHWPDAHPNTLEAFRRAAPHSQVLDIDVWATADGVLVCAHDDVVDHDSSARISQSPWSELASTTPIPRLADVIDAFPEHRLNIELKDARGLVALRDLIAEHDIADRTCLSTFSPLLARALAGAVPTAAHARPTARRIGRLWGSGDVIQTMTFVPDAAPALGPAKPLILRALFSAGSPEGVGRQVPIASAKGFPLFAWTANEPDGLQTLIDAEVDAVLSDRPELFDQPAPA